MIPLLYCSLFIPLMTQPSHRRPSSLRGGKDGSEGPRDVHMAATHAGSAHHPCSWLVPARHTLAYSQRPFHVPTLVRRHCLVCRPAGDQRAAEKFFVVVAVINSVGIASTIYIPSLPGELGNGGGLVRRRRQRAMACPGGGSAWAAAAARATFEGGERASTGRARVAGRARHAWVL